MLLHRCLATALIITLGVTCSLCAGAEPATDAKKALQTIYQKRDAAVQNKDVNGSLASTSPDFVYVSKDGQQGDLKLLKRKMTPLLGLMQSIKAKTSVQKVTLKGNEASVLVKQHLEMLMINPETQMPQKFVMDAVSNDLWTKTTTGWLEKRMTTTAEKALVNGKSIDDKIDLNAVPGQGTGNPAKQKSPKKIHKKSP